MASELPYPTRDDPDVIFKAVYLVCGPRSCFGGLPHISKTVNAFIGVDSSWTVASACEEGLPKLAKILLSLDDSQTLDMRYVATLCNRGIDIAAHDGRLPILENFVRYFPGLVITHATKIAARKGQLHILSWLHEQRWRVCWGRDVLSEAVYEGHFSAVLHLCNMYKMVPSPDMLRVAVQRNHVSLAEWLWITAAEQGEVENMEHAIAIADLPMAKILVAVGFEKLVIPIDAAAARGDMDFILWAHAHGASATTRAMDDAAAYGHLDVVRWLFEHRTEGCTVEAMDRAALGGHLRVLKWLRTNTTAGFTGAALLNAATRGHRDVLWWLHQRRSGIVYPPGTFDQACAHGQLDVVILLNSLGFGGPTPRAMDFAAANGHLRVVEWLNELRHEGCTTDAMDLAATNGHFHVLKWLHNHRSEGCTTNAIDGAARHGHYAIIQWLHFKRDEGCTVDAMRNAAEFGSIDIVDWLHKNRDEGCTSAAMDVAIASGNLELVKWFYENREEGCTPQGMDEAAGNGHFDVLEYLRVEGVVECSPAAFRNAVLADELYIASWIDYHYRHRLVLGQMNSYFPENGWTWSILRAAFD